MTYTYVTQLGPIAVRSQLDRLDVPGEVTGGRIEIRGLLIAPSPGANSDRGKPPATDVGSWFFSDLSQRA